MKNFAVFASRPGEKSTRLNFPATNHAQAIAMAKAVCPDHTVVALIEREKKA